MGCHLELSLHLGVPLAWPVIKGRQESKTTQWIEKARDHRIHRPTQNFAYYGDNNVKNWIGLVLSQALGVFELRNTWVRILIHIFIFCVILALPFHLTELYFLIHNFKSV